MNRLLVAIVLTASTAYARLPEEECEAARRDVQAFATSVREARQNADKLTASAASLKTANDWKNALDGITTVAFMTVKVVTNAYALAKGGATAAIKAITLTGGSASLEDILKNSLAVDSAEKLKAKMSDREKAVSTAARLADAAEKDAKRLKQGLAEANTSLSKYGCGRVE
jgi:hypothetical protein